MLAEHSKSKKIFDNGFQIAKNADLASKIYGKENVINATLGIFYNDNEEMHTLDIVNNVKLLLHLVVSVLYIILLKII